MKSTIAQPNQYEGGGTKTVSMFSKLVSQGSSFVMEGVKNLVVKRHVRELNSLKPKFCTVFSSTTLTLSLSLCLYRICRLPKSRNN